MGRIHANTASRQNTHLSLSRRATLIGVIGAVLGGDWGSLDDNPIGAFDRGHVRVTPLLLY